MHFGKYRFVKKLATGGMAEVFLARAAGPMGFEKSLVIKRILPHLSEDPRFLEMFLSEARLAAQLNHPNVVQIFDFGEFEGTYYLAMEYIDGPNLRTLSRRAREAGERLPLVCCAKIIAHACEGLAFAHDFSSPETGEPLNLIHRDVSPDNILLSRQGAVKVVDFGIAKAANQEHRTQTGLIKGKIAYMPPEQVQGRPLDHRVDVYALGVVLYELLTGEKPFEATTDLSMMQAIVSEPIVPADVRRPDVPRVLSQIVERALKKDREQRYPDCRAFQMELERFILSTHESVGAWQLSQLVLTILGEAPSPTPAPFSGTSSGSFPGTGCGIARADTVIRGHSNHLGQENQTSSAAELATDLTSRELTDAEDAPVAAGKERSVPSPSKRRIGWSVALAGLALIIAGSGVTFWGIRASKEAIVRGEPLPPGTAQGTEAPQGHPAAILSPQAVVQEPAPGPELQTAGEMRPTEKATAEEPEPQPKQPPMRLASRSKGTRRVAQPGPTLEVAQPEPSEPSPDVAPPSPLPTPRASEKAMLEFRIRPYAIVVLDGKQIGHTPLGPTEVEVGTHTVRLINHALRKEVTRTIEVKAGQSNIFKHNLLEE